MQISTITAALETWAPLSYQESYDNAGLIIGDPLANCTGILCSLDCTEAVVDEADGDGAAHAQRLEEGAEISLGRAIGRELG